MTEKEAKAKWCPFAQISYQIYANKGTHEQARCGGQYCMMWRWENIRVEDVQKIQDENPNLTAQECADKVTREGYCGLGGEQR